ncbi:MAG: YihY/virulence factor BrkB family protein [Actinomycetaceae bacterium]|nr:YihY/virulence factor BrkB family protein [Actinomycetaceae bacterium]
MDQPHPTYPEASPTLKSVFSGKTLGEKFSFAGEYWQNTRVSRLLARYGMQRGALLAGGISYTAIFSLFSALALGVTVFMAVLGKNQPLRDSVFGAINKALPGILETGGAQGLIKPEQLVLDTPFTLTGFVAIVVLVLSATRVMQALKVSIRDIFGIRLLTTNAVVEKLKDVLGFIVLALSVLATALVGVLSSGAGAIVLQSVGVEGALASFLLHVLSVVGAALVDAVVFWMLVRVIAGVRVPRQDLWQSLAIFAVGSGVLRYAGTRLVSSVSDNPILAGSVALVTILLWVNMLARVTLMVCAYMANPPRPVLPTVPETLHAQETPNYVTLSDATSLTWLHHSITGAVEPDMSLDPNRPRPHPRTRRWGGIIGRIQDARLQRLRTKLQKAEARLYVEPGLD